MSRGFDRLYTALVGRAAGYGIRVRSRSLEPETPAKCDGPTVLLDPAYDSESQ